MQFVLELLGWFKIQIIHYEIKELGEQMKLEKQVCSFELGENIKKLRVIYDSYFYWAIPIWDGNKSLPPKVFHIVDWSDFTEMTGYKPVCQAYTVAELGELLPDDTSTRRSMMGHIVRNFDPDISFMEQTEADARAKLLIYLIENKLIEVNNE